MSGLLALVLSAVAVVVTVYFIDRSLTIIGLTDAGRTSDIPLWQGWSEAIDVYRSWWDFDQTRVLMWLGAAWWRRPHRRPSRRTRRRHRRLAQARPRTLP